MIHPRLRHNLVMLPDGHVLAIGGESPRTLVNTIDGESVTVYQGCPVLNAEWFSPESRTWTELADMQIPRAHHSIAMLLKDGRVLVSGGEHYNNTDVDGFVYPVDGTSAEIYSPPYLFDEDRPKIGYAPTVIHYGSAFRISTTNDGLQANDIEKITLVRLGALTHGFDQNQRFVELNVFARVGGKLGVDAPADGSVAPPGYYVLFLVSDDGVPSIGEYVQVK